MMVEALRADYKVLGDYRIRERGQRMIQIEHKNTDKHMTADIYLNISIATQSMSIGSINLSRKHADIQHIHIGVQCCNEYYNIGTE